MKGRTRRLGVLGGTFDPLHYAHLRIAEESYERLGLDRVLLVLAASPPHKGTVEVTPFQTRWEMLEAVCRTNPRLEAIDLEIKRQGPSYTIDTLDEIRSIYGADSEIFLLVGMDCAVEFTTWRSYREILDRARLVVYGRPGENRERIDPSLRKQMLLLDWEEFGISSTEIRRKVLEGKSIRYLVPPEVEKLIERDGLYLSPDLRSESTKKKNTPGEVFA